MKEIVKIINPKQAGLYIKHGIKPIDMVYTDVLVFIFDKEETNKLYQLWLRHKLI